MGYSEHTEGLGNYQPYGALYIHVPFCKQRCLYCDFTTEAVDCDSLALRSYADEMVLSIRRAGKQGFLGQLDTVYMGGGTPSFLGQKYLTEIFYTLSLSMHLSEGVECTMETNPDSLTAPLVRDLWALGVNRLSLGVQSFKDKELAALGRIHTATQAQEAVLAAKERFENISIDLMCGIPGQTHTSFEDSLQTALELDVSHISIYPLTIEENTPFDRLRDAGEMEDVDPDFQADCMELAEHVLGEAGFARYEVASYARPGFECRHNIAYWTGVPYLGLGQGAVSMKQNARERVRFNSQGEIERLNATQMLAEDLMLGMRMSAGIGPDLLEQASMVFPTFDSTIEDLLAKDMVRWEGARLVPTKRGWLCGNELYGALLYLS